MKITPLAADSMGCRSMATLVETQDVSVLIDPSANVAKFRYGLSPHPLEIWCLRKLRDRIRLFTQSTDIFIITHYHHDHYFSDEYEIYRDKILFIKNPNQHINTKQRNRAFAFLKQIKGISKEVNYVDGRGYTIGNTQFNFSDPLPHGDSKDRGYVIQVAIRSEERNFLFTSDIQGFCSNESISFILDQNPDFLYIDGPTTYLHSTEVPEKNISKSLDRLIRIVRETKVKDIIIDHHLIRDLYWRDHIKPFFEFALKQNVVVRTAASFRGESDNPLEARREQLYESEPPWE